MDILKHRVITWIDLKKRKTFYGVDVQILDKGEKEWCHCLNDDDTPMWFDKKKDANTKCRKLNKEYKNSK